MADETTTDIEILRTGTHTATDGITQLTVTRDDLVALAAAYDPAMGEAPLVIGHPALNAPAFGWAKKLDVRGDVLFAAAGELDPEFRQAVKAGRYKKRSASLFTPNAPGNPKPGSLYLRHIGFLGAAVPAVTGLRDVSFAAADGAVTVEFAANQPWWVLREIASLFRRWRESIVAEKGVEAADALVPAYQIDSINEAAQVAQIAADPMPSFAAPAPAQVEPVMSDTVDLAAQQAALTTREQQLSAREAALAASERTRIREGVVSFAGALVQSGQLLPRDQPAVVELLTTLEVAPTPTTINFASPDGTQVSESAGATLRRLLSGMAVQTPMGELSAGEAAALGASFAAPAGVAVDTERMRLHNAALAFQRSHAGTSYIDAVRAVGG